jgi:hypothetical protein
MKHHFLLIAFITFLQLFHSITSISFNLDSLNINPEAMTNNALSFTDAGDFSEITEAFQEFYQEEYPHIYQQPSSAPSTPSPSQPDDINIDDLDPYGFWDD